MCEECYMTFCPSGCPGYEPEPIGRCEKCNSYIYGGDGHIAAGETLYCRDCVESFDTDGILAVCGFCAVFDLLCELGVEAVRGDE